MGRKMNMLDSNTPKQFMGYFGVAFVALLTNIISRYMLGLYVSFTLSVIFAYILGHFVNFALSAKFVFRSEISLKLAFVRFSLVALFGLITTFIVSIILLKILNLDISQDIITHILAFAFIETSKETLQTLIEFIAHICGVGASFICNFLGHKFFSFKAIGKFNLDSKNNIHKKTATDFTKQNPHNDIEEKNADSHSDKRLLAYLKHKGII